MIHSSSYKPTVSPIFADLNPVEIDRLQELTATTTLTRTKIEEIGRDGLVDWQKANPEVSVALRQLEYGSLEFYRQLANLGPTVSTISMTDFKTPAVDIHGYKTDDSGTFLGTIRYPNLRLAGMGLAIGDPDALIERSFALVGEDEVALINNNKYVIHKRFAASGGNDETFAVNDPTPILDPDSSGQYLFRVVKVSGGTATLLTHGTDWSYDGSSTLTVNGSTTAGDIIKVWYSATTYVSGQDPFVLNDSDLAGISADSCTIFLESSNQLYRLQGVGIDTTFDRFDIKEIGNTDVVSRGVRDITNRITLGRILEDYTIEEVLRGQAGQSYGKIDVRKFSDELNLIVKIYEDNTKTTFKMGYKYTDLAPVGVDAGTPVNDYVSRGVTLEGETGLITTIDAIL